MDHAVGRAPFSHVERPLEELAGVLAEQIDAVAEPACERSRGKAVAALIFASMSFGSHRASGLFRGADGESSIYVPIPIN